MAGTDDTDPGATDVDHWAPIGAGGQVSFPTLGNTLDQPTRSLALHVRLVGFPDSQIVLEGDIQDLNARIAAS